MPGKLTKVRLSAAFRSIGCKGAVFCGKRDMRFTVSKDTFCLTVYVFGSAGLYCFFATGFDKLSLFAGLGSTRFFCSVMRGQNGCYRFVRV